MLLRKLEIHHIGPFTFPVEIEFEEDVTVLTGPNDTGKSVVLRLLSLISQNKPIAESDVNITYLFQSDTGKVWEKDDKIHCIATYRLASNYKWYVPSGLLIRSTPKEVYFQVRHTLVPQILRSQIISTKRGNSVAQITMPVARLPLSITLNPSSSQIGSEINLEKPRSKIEEIFIQLAFGQNAAQRLKKMSPHNRRLALRKAETTLNDGLSSILPASLPMEFILDWAEANPLRVLVSLKDAHNEVISLNRRGAGVRKIIALMVLLLDAQKKAQEETVWILIDEPENALHADAQHYLRQFLEDLAVSDKIQVMYATHSPAMINPLRAHSIRLFKRIQKNGIPTTIVDNTPYEENFYPIRASLGISPSDSLLYAPITVVIEGPTEQLVIPEILKRLEETGHATFEGVQRLLSLSHFLVGQGGSLDYWCRLAQSQGATPIFFVDADMRKRVEQARIREKCANVSIVDLGDSREIEDIVDQEVYFAALQEYLEDPSLSTAEFQRWLSAASEERPNLSRMATSKKIEYWLVNAKGHTTYRKPQIMRLALQKITDIEQQIEIAPFEELVRAMRNAIQKQRGG